MNKYETTTGFWSAGRFWLPIWEKRVDGQYSTGFYLDATASSNKATEYRKNLMSLVNTLGIVGAARLSADIVSVDQQREFENRVSKAHAANLANVMGYTG